VDGEYLIPCFPRKCPLDSSCTGMTGRGPFNLRHFTLYKKIIKFADKATINGIKIKIR
jgi:hypothetical protein